MPGTMLYAGTKLKDYIISDNLFPLMTLFLIITVRLVLIQSLQVGVI